jgi:hypothetical protein
LLPNPQEWSILKSPRSSFWIPSFSSRLSDSPI